MHMSVNNIKSNLLNWINRREYCDKNWRTDDARACQKRIKQKIIFKQHEPESWKWENIVKFRFYPVKSTVNFQVYVKV
jgi:hypothetical protein